jgi:cell division protein FtsI/penicillin-binding protein 2
MAFVALGMRCVQVQSAQHEHYVDISMKQHRVPLAQQGGRGVIFDCRMRFLAADQQVLTIYADPNFIITPKETSVALAEILDMGAHTICKMITANRQLRFKKIKTPASLDECLAVMKQNIRGVGVQPSWRRRYPMGPLTSHVVGFAGIGAKSRAGIELQYDRELSGNTESLCFLKDVKGRPIRLMENAVRQPMGHIQGQGIILTIDATIQQFVRNAVLEQMTAFEAESAWAVVANPKTGAVLAMVSLPDFDPANIRRGDKALCNHIAVDQYEPGSIMKPMVVAIALDAGVITRSTQIFCEDGWYTGKKFGRIKEWNYKKYGMLTPRQILINSSNIGVAKIGQKLGARRLYDGLRLFGFGKKTGLGLPGETKGLLRDPSLWDQYSVTRIPFGQEVAVTAMQMVKAFCILANEGRVVRPHLIKAFVDKHGEPIVRDSGFRVADQVGHVIEPETANWLVTRALTDVVNEGTGKKAKLDKWQLFGKSGTAQIAKRDGRGYEDGAYIASFIAGAPSQDPAVVVLVSICRPNRKLGNGYSGGTVAAPVVGRIMEKTLGYLESRGHRLVRKDAI